MGLQCTGIAPIVFLVGFYSDNFWFCIGFSWAYIGFIVFLYGLYSVCIGSIGFTLCSFWISIGSLLCLLA